MPGSDSTMEIEAIPTPPEGVTPQSETKIIQDARALGERGKIQIALAYANIVTYEFFRYFDCASVEEYFEKVFKGEPSLSSVQDWAAVAAVFDSDVVAQLTCHKLLHFLTYARRKGIEDLSNPGDTSIEVPEDDGIVAKPLRDCTTTELERALARLGKPRAALSSEFDDRARRLQAGLAGFLGAESFVRVNIERRGRGAVIQIDNLQVPEADRLLQLLPLG